MKITPKTQTLHQLLQPDSDVDYSVPVYQRNYSWKEEQIDILFNDIKVEEKGYYVGNLLINNTDDENNIIDGQQRLTTLSLFLLALHERLQDFKQVEKSDDVEEEYVYAKSTLKKFLLNDNEPRLHLLDNDKKVWENLVKVLKDGQPGGWKRYTLFKRYEFIKKELTGKLSDLDETLAFYNKIINIELLQISVPDLSDAYQVFASLNSKGLPLTPLDLLKNIFISRGGEVEKWSELKSLFEKEDEVNETKLRQFILNNYDGLENYSTSQSLTKGRIVKEYEKIFKNQGAQYIDKLIYRAQIYNEISNNDTEYSFNLSGLAKLDATTSYPLLLNLYTNKESYELNDNHLEKIINILIKLFVRRNIALVPKASNLRNDLLTLKNHIYKNQLKGEEIVNYIENHINKLKPNDDLIKQSLKDGIYDKNKKTTRFILISLERKLGKYFNKARKDTLDDFTNNGSLIWSIEHILPQGPNLLDEWKDMISPDDREKANEIQDEYVHLLGNLTLTPYNSELGNRTFKEKIDFKDKDTEVGLKLELGLNNSIDVKKDSWNIDDINKRNEVLIQDVLKLF
ncbi:DUF262 domain-containing protein [Staphylococcus haemolyticus]|uniref:DUF262 domain-containing protein n=1 Tax=Staphylococcus haemolyticus TaxID=1283 RepID=UPI001F0B44DD|nr:DUF262 domain-containing protein [Staphylococcus haemolyticus]MCH4458074.1 DUF262 domain-containing HNH endonuclease family protein [Staphylococcus haemolyticus]MCH4490737.1 DUF262 domain-containing HNH endonuclease family protein [Staphylococcus haemolyticus]MDU0435335.1 DUF262 domain-containing HNH endonuclease family protein [Staphylococcus haemolyticus]